MKFFSLLIGCLLTFCTLKAQDSTVCIHNNVARWFLEQKDEAILLRKQVKVQDQIITNLRETTNTKDLIIQSYQRDSVHYLNIITSNQEHLNLLYKDLELSNKEIKGSCINWYRNCRYIRNTMTTTKDELVKQILSITKNKQEILEINPIYEKSPEYLEKLLKVVKLLPK